MGDADPVNLAQKTCLVYDHGLFVELAARLARDFRRVYYFCPWKISFPKMVEVAPGEGVEGVTRVYDLFSVIDQVDLFVFPDVYDGDLQVYLRQQGKRVWGAGRAEYLELDRVKARRTLAEQGVQSPPWQEVVGLTALRQLLEQVDDRWVKTSMFRGDFETYHHETGELSQPFLDDLAANYGPQAESVEFLVEEGVEGVEIAYDGYTVDGQFPDKALWGVEVKDRGYVGEVVEYTDLPEQIQQVNRLVAPVLEVEECRSFVSFEMRVGEDGVPKVIDPAMRCGNPPTEAWLELYENLAEVFWEGAAGNLVSPKPVARFTAMAVIVSSWAEKKWCPVSCPEEIEQWVKLRFLTVIDGVRYYAPNVSGMTEIGAVVGLGDTLEEAVALVQERAAQVKGYKLDVRADEVLAKAAEAVEEVKAGLGG